MKKLVLIVGGLVLSGSVYATGIVDTGLHSGEGNSVYEDFPGLFVSDHVAKNDAKSSVVNQPEVGDSSDNYLDDLLNTTDLP